jgi:hypothetical protein
VNIIAENNRRGTSIGDRKKRKKPGKEPSRKKARKDEEIVPANRKSGLRIGGG